jgi:hypothetical protein
MAQVFDRIVQSIDPPTQSVNPPTQSVNPPTQSVNLTARTFNVNKINVSGRIGRSMELLNFDIDFYQEIAFEKIIFTNPSFQLKETENNFFFLRDGIVCGIGSLKIGMSSPTAGAKTVPKVDSTGCLVLWNPTKFMCVGKVIPTYQETSMTSGGSELGSRTSQWIHLKHKETGKILRVLSLHGSVHNTKRSILIESVLADIHLRSTVSKPIVIIAGDFNAKSSEIQSYKKPDMTFVGDFTKVTHVNPSNTDFTTRLDYFCISTSINFISEEVEGIEQNDNRSVMKSGMKKHGHDHGIVIVKLAF